MASDDSGSESERMRIERFAKPFGKFTEALTKKMDSFTNDCHRRFSRQ